MGKKEKKKQTQDSLLGVILANVLRTMKLIFSQCIVRNIELEKKLLRTRYRHNK